VTGDVEQQVLAAARAPCPAHQPAPPVDLVLTGHPLRAVRLAGQRERQQRARLGGEQQVVARPAVAVQVDGVVRAEPGAGGRTVEPVRRDDGVHHPEGL
jgi:hypothetical protein